MPGISVGLCTREAMKLYCMDTFYGPIETRTANMFYLSVMNPSTLGIPEYQWFNATHTDDFGYAYGILDMDTLKVPAPTRNSSSQCVKDLSMLKVNLGR
jgi:hypothetical protein